MHQKGRKQFAEDKQTKDMDYWNHVMWSDETKINVFDLDGVKRVWQQPGEEYKDMRVFPTTGELQFIEGTMNANMYCDILKKSMIPSLRRLGRRAVFQHDNDPKHTSKTTTALLKKLRVKVMNWPSMSPDLNPIEHLWGILKRKVEEHKVSNIHQLCDVVMEEWNRIPVATCEALVNSMPTCWVKAVLLVLRVPPKQRPTCQGMDPTRPLGILWYLAPRH
uniref:Tc1-like transposase DDE domain-containing protein n=1 Tax=Esox lucius TaxID=8010 RepID=A0AAY5LDB2_ESOLU